MKVLRRPADPYTDPCLVCVQSVSDVLSSTDHVVLVVGASAIALRIVHQPCVITRGMDIFRDTQAQLKRVTCGRCSLPLSYHHIGSSVAGGSDSYARCADGSGFELAT